MAKRPQVGDSAPDFELDGTGGSFRLSDHRGERVILLFYPGDNTAVCTKQFCSYRDNAEAFGALDATVVGISNQSVGSHRAFSDTNNLNVPLLGVGSSPVVSPTLAETDCFFGSLGNSPPCSGRRNWR